jgi:hypothetical protein
MLHHVLNTPQVLNLTIDIPNWCGKWVLPMNEFRDGVVGAKSKNIANLRGKIPDWIRLPAAVTVPFSSFEQVGLQCDGPSLIVSLNFFCACWLQAPCPSAASSR